MATTATVRASLWLSVPFNLLAAYAFAAPASELGSRIGLRTEVPRLYALVLACCCCGSAERRTARLR